MTKLVDVLRLNPVSLPKGNPKQVEVEFSFSGTIPFSLVRLYDGGSDKITPNGYGQFSNLDIRIVDHYSGYALIDESGDEIIFDPPGAKPGNRSGTNDIALTQTGRREFRVYRQDQILDFKRLGGRVWNVVAISDLNGNKIVFNYGEDYRLTGIRHPDGLGIEIFENELGLRAGLDLLGINGKRLPLLRYVYDNSRRLVAAENMYGNSYSYGYAQENKRSKFLDIGSTETSFSFDDDGRVIAVKPVSQYRKGSVSYGNDEQLATVFHGSDPESFEKLYFDKDGRHFMTALPDGSISYRHFDDSHQLIGETDANGNRTSYEYDAFGNIQSVKDPEGRETFMVWDDMGNVITHIDNAGNKTRYEYDDNGNLTQVKSPIGYMSFIKNNERGQPIKITRDDGHVETRDYDEFNRLTQITDFGGGTTKFTYDEFNRPVTITDASDAVTKLHYDDTMRGRDFNTPSSITRPDGVTTSRTFNSTGTINTLTDGEGRTTQYEYGAYNVLEGIIDPKGNKLKFAYNSREQLTKVTNQLGLDWVFERDNLGRVRTETDFDGRTLTYDYDPGGRVTKRTNPDDSTLAYDYDKSGRLTKLTATEANGRAWETTYDYDENGALAAAENPDAKIELERDEMGRIIRETQNDIDILNAYDCCSNRFRREIGDQKLLTYRTPGGAVRHWELDGHKPLAFGHDVLGRETERYSFAGFVQRQRYDQIGQLQTQSAGKAAFDNETLARFDPAASRQYNWSRAFDPVAIRSSRWGDKAYEYDRNGQITKTDYGDAAEHFKYNRDLNLAGSGEAKPDPLTQMAHAAQGTEGSDKFLNWQTSAAGVVRAARGPRGERVELEHDTNGRVIRRRITRNGFRPQEWTFAWNALDQMVSTTTPDGEIWHYAYDPFGRRVLKENKTTGVKTTFIWDGDVLAFETTDNQTVEWFFEPDSFRPLARRENGVLHYIVNDHLGTPKEAFAETGELVWSVDHDTWGTVRRVWMSASLDPQPDERGVYLGTGTDGEDVYSLRPKRSRQITAPSQNPNPLFIPIRFQGQYEDAETELFYNRYRYYDAYTGRYISKDPIGFTGETAIDRYVDSPNKLVDPFGLKGVTARRNGPGGCGTDWIVELSRSVYPETAGHIADAIQSGLPNHVTTDRPNAPANRRASLRGSAKPCCGYDRDEWPMAMFEEGGTGASIREILASDNRGAGSSIGHALRDAGIADGETICFRIVP